VESGVVPGVPLDVFLAAFAWRYLEEFPRGEGDCIGVVDQRQSAVFVGAVRQLSEVLINGHRYIAIMTFHQRLQCTTHTRMHHKIVNRRFRA